MFILYDIIFLLFAIAYLPAFLFKKKIHAGLGMRFGILPKDSKFDRPVWVHCVSVGEAMSVKHLVEGLRKDLPGKKFVISTVTTTGNRIAQAIASDGDFVTYLPLDLSFVVKKVIDRINPCIFVVAETEIWPNLIRYLHKKNIPIVTVNARISDKSFRGYQSVRFLLSGILNKIDTFCVQSEQDAERLMMLAVSKDKIKITNNMKFDIQVRDYTELKKDYTNYRLKFGLEANDRLLIAASTHQGEEEMVLAVYKKLLKKFPIRLIIAPRHPERAASVEKMITGYKLNSIMISKLAPRLSAQQNQPEVADRQDIFILDTIGQLMYFYAISDLVFVGGSLVRKGGHNILEPASLGKAVIFGPHMFNFRDIANLFLRAKAAVMVKDEKELQESIEYLLSNDSKIVELGTLAKGILQKNQGATQRNRAIILGLLKAAQK